MPCTKIKEPIVHTPKTHLKCGSRRAKTTGGMCVCLPDSRQKGTYDPNKPMNTPWPRLCSAIGSFIQRTTTMKNKPALPKNLPLFLNGRGTTGNSCIGKVRSLTAVGSLD